MTISAKTLRVASYNTHRAIGMDGKQRPLRIRAVIQELAADVIALQEVEKRDDSELVALEDFASEHGYQLLRGPTMFEPAGHYGNALLTRLPVAATHRLDISYRGREPRGALIVDSRWEDASLRLVATHLGLLPAERRQQLRRLLPFLEPETGVDVTVLMGDLNEWFLWGRPLRLLHRLFPSTPMRRSFPSRWPIFPLDSIWTRPAECVDTLWTHRSELSRIASDHLPVVADLRC